MTMMKTKTRTLTDKEKVIAMMDGVIHRLIGTDDFHMAYSKEVPLFNGLSDTYKVRDISKAVELETTEHSPSLTQFEACIMNSISHLADQRHSSAKVEVNWAIGFDENSNRIYALYGVELA